MDTDADQEVLEVSDLTFGYRGLRRRRPVFEGFTWTVTPGAVTMLLGPNGAGKSTLLKLMCGFERPSAGSVAFGGASSRNALYRSVGWMPQDIQPARGLTVAEQIAYAAWVAGASQREARVAADEALRQVDLMEKRDVRTTELSGGQLRRVGLAQALVRQGDVLLLDEPTAGLDPAQALNFRRIVRSLDRRAGIVISTHQVTDLADDVDRVAVLQHGVITFDGTTSEFKALAQDPEDRESLARVFSAMIGGGKH